jgi:hypothetical protein
LTILSGIVTEVADVAQSCTSTVFADVISYVKSPTVKVFWPIADIVNSTAHNEEINLFITIDIKKIPKVFRLLGFLI